MLHGVWFLQKYDLHEVGNKKISNKGKKMKTSSRVFVMFMFLSISVTSLLLPQTTEDKKEEKKSSSKALQIGFLNEKALYYHNELTDKLALKSGVSVYLNYDEKKDGDGYTNHKYSHGSTEQTKFTMVESFSSSRGVVLSSLLLYRFTDYEYAQLYFACGPTFSYTLAKSSSGYSENTDTTISNSSSESKSTTVGIGPSFSFIIKSHIYANISLISEYNLSAYYTWNKELYNSDSKSNSAYDLTNYNYYSTQYHVETKGWKITLSDVRIGLLIAL